jgi:hypothetical protein
MVNCDERNGSQDSVGMSQVRVVRISFAGKPRCGVSRLTFKCCDNGVIGTVYCILDDNDGFAKADRIRLTIGRP